MSELPLNLKQIFLLIFSLIVISSLITFKIIEDVSWLDAIYFVVVTMSTVGFGDVTAHYTITKIVTLILIFNGIISIGILSQLLLHRIVKFQLLRQKLLPTKPLNMENHIIIVGYGSKGRRLAQLFKDRMYKVVIVEKGDDRAKLADFNGYQVIQGDITKPSVLEILSLKRADALCLLLNNDNITIQTGIVARSISDEIDIYAEIKSSSIYDIARVAGINKPIPVISFMTNQIQNHLSHANIELFFNLKELRQQEASLGYALIHLSLDYWDVFKDSYRLGLYSIALNEFYHDYKSNVTPDTIINCNHLLIAVDRLELIKNYKGENTVQIPHQRIIFAGYSELVDSVIQRLEPTEEDVLILWKTEIEKDLSENIKCNKYQWKFEQANEILDKIIRYDDLVVCTFNDITDSLVLAVALKKLDRETHLVQVVPYEYEVEPFISVGASTVITPQIVISNAILSSYLKENQLPPSITFNNAHIFEYIVQKNDLFYNKRIKDTAINNLQILFIRSIDEKKFRVPIKSEKIHEQDRLLIQIIYSE